MTATRRVSLLMVVLASACVAADTGPQSDTDAIHKLLSQYAQAVDTVDLGLLSHIWSHSPEVTFIYPLGEERGFDNISEHVFTKVMGGMFSTRDLQMRDVAVHVNGPLAWSEFHWVFHATMRSNGLPVTTRGVETQIYKKEDGAWHIVHVHYSEDRQPTP